MKVVVNKCYGGFGLSDKAVEMIMNRKGLGCFRYDWDVKNYRFVKLQSVQDAYMVYYLTKDMGEEFHQKDFPNDYNWYGGNIERTDIDLIEVVGELGEEANGRFAKLVVVEIPDDINWYIDEHDGWEIVREEHRSW